MANTNAKAPVVVSDGGRLLRLLGLGFGMAVTIGNTIGAGILRAPGEIAAQVPNQWVFFAIWLGGGLYALLGAISVAELGTMMPYAGGQYVYAKRALGSYAGFVVGWSDWLSTAGSIAAVSIVIGEYVRELFPAVTLQPTSIAAAVVVVFTLIQWRGLRWGQRAQEITSVLKALAFVLLVAGAFAIASSPEAEPAQVSTAVVAPALLTGILVSLQAVIYTYDGWTAVVYFSEEVQEPARDIPRSLFAGVVTVMVIYLAVNAAIFSVTSYEALRGDIFAVATIAKAVVGDFGGVAIRVLMIISLLATINAFLLMSTRVLFGMARDRLMTRRVVSVNRGGTPVPALFVSAAVGLLFLLSGTFEKVIALLAFFFVANYAVSFLSVFVLRRRAPDAARPHRAWGYPWTTAASLLGSVAFLAAAVATDTTNSLWALGLLSASAPVFLLVRRFSGRTQPA